MAMSIPIYRMEPDASFAMARLLPGLSVSMKATAVAGESVESATGRGRSHRLVKNFLMHDKKNKRLIRAQPENLQSRSKYVLLQQRGRALFYTEVDLFKTSLESNKELDDDNAIDQAEIAELQRRQQVMARLQRGHSKISNFLSVGEKDDDNVEPVLRATVRQRTARKTKHELGLADDTRDMDFEEEFDDDDLEEKVAFDNTTDAQNPDQIDENKDLSAAGKKIAQILSKSEDLDDFSEDEDEDDMEEEEDVMDEDKQVDTPSGATSSRKRQADAIDPEGTSKRVRVVDSASTVAVASTSSSPPQDVFVTDDEVREQFRKHGRLTVKSLARIMEDTWKYKGKQARKELFAIVQRICIYQADQNRPGVKYLILKP